MKKPLLLSLSALAMGLSLLSCAQSKKETSYYLDSKNDLIVVYNDGSESNLGSWGDGLIGSLGSVTVSEGGFYVINGVATTIKANLPASYAIDSKGHLIVTYKDGSTEDLGDFTETCVNGVESVEVSEDGYYVINGIKTSIVATKAYTVSFDTGFSDKVEPQKVKDGYKVTKPELERTGYTLDGWFCNDEEWRFNSDVVKSDITLKAKWTGNEYNVTFFDGMNQTMVNTTVTYGAVAEFPKVKEVAGCTFAGWYDGESLVEPGEWAIAYDVTLMAKWTMNTYTITLDPGVGSVSSSSVDVVYGESYTLPVPTNDYGVFAGWLLDGVKMTDEEGKSLSVWLFAEDKTFTMDWVIDVETEGDLLKMHAFPNAEFSIKNDIALTKAWTPVGTGDKPFTGTIHGNGKTISGLSMTADASKDAYGLIGYASGAMVDGLSLSGVSFTASNIETAYSVGSLIGKSDEEKPSTISGIKVSGTYAISRQSTSYPITAGGVIGSSPKDAISDCVNHIDISNAVYSGGVAGSTVIGSIDGCYNDAKITGIKFAGGIVGRTTGSIEVKKCKNVGEIEGIYSAGGIVGWSTRRASFELCMNAGEITASANEVFKGAGGLLGSGYETSSDEFVTVKSLAECVSILRSYNAGSINGPRTGGLAGPIYKISAEQSYNCGAVHGTKFAASLYASSSFSSVKECLASGSITGDGVNGTFGTGSTTETWVDSYHTFSETTNWIEDAGTYTADYYGSDLYVNSMFWSEYNAETKQGTWIFSENGYPTLAVESAFGI